MDTSEAVSTLYERLRQEKEEVYEDYLKFMAVPVMNRATLTRASCPLMTPDRFASVPWFEEQRLKPEKQAEYLHRLSQLRESLVQQESVNLNNAISRTLNSFPKVFIAQGNVRKKQTAPVAESAPQRHLRLQTERAERLDMHRRQAFMSPPPLNVTVRQIAEPGKNRKPKQLLETPMKDPFDARVLESADPFDRLFNIERERLANAMAAQIATRDRQKENEKGDTSKSPASGSSMSSKKGRNIQVRQKDLLTPRRGNEWFISGRYKKEKRKPFKIKMPKAHGTHAPKDKGAKPASTTTQDSKLINRIESGTGEKDLLKRLDTAGSGDGKGCYVVPTPTPVPWDKSRPESVSVKPRIALTGPNSALRERVLINTITDMNDVSKPQTPYSSESPRQEGRTSNAEKYNELPHSKAITAVLQANSAGHPSEFYPRHRHNLEQVPKFRKGLQGGLKNSKKMVDSTLPVPVTTGLRPAENVEPISSRFEPEADDKLRVVSNTPLVGLQAEPLHIPARTSHPRINLRHSSPDMLPRDEVEDPGSEVSLKKVFRQNELRQRELNNLFEDIKELNHFSESLEIVEKYNS